MKGNVIILSLNGRKYGMRKMPPLQGSAFGIKVSVALSRILAKPEAKEALIKLQGISKATDIGNSVALDIGGTILGLLSGVDPAELNAIFHEALSYEVFYEDSRLSDENFFEEHFSEYPQDLYIVAIWAVYNHVRDFFTGIGDGVKALTKASGEAKAEESPFPKNAGSIGR